MPQSHRITDNGEKVLIHDLEVFCAYDPSIDGDHDSELEKFDNDRVKRIVTETSKHMGRGSFPQLVVMHEKNGDEPKSCVGRFTRLAYQERNGVGYIVGDCEVERSVFERLLATNAFPRRSAEIWQEQDHLSEVALLGRETPRRPLPDTHFARRGKPIVFARPLRFGTIGGGLSSFIPDTKGIKTMTEEDKKEIASLKAQMSEISTRLSKYAMDDEDDEKIENEADDMLSTQFAEDEEGDEGIHIDIGSHDNEEEEEEEDKAVFPASRFSRSEFYAMRRENTRMARELATIKAQLTAERFGREIDAMEAEGYRIPASRRPRLIAELVSSKDPDALIDSWRELFSRDATGVRIDMSRAAAAVSAAETVDPKEIAKLVKEHAGNPAAFAKAVNARIKR